MGAQLPASSTEVSDAGCGWFKPRPSAEARRSLQPGGSRWWVEGATRQCRTKIDAHQPCETPSEPPCDQSSRLTINPDLSFGANQVDFGGIISPRSDTAINSAMPVGWSAKPTS